MKITSLYDANGFKATGPSMLLVHESEHMKVLNFNFAPGQGLPIHSHALEGELTLTVLSGTGEFLSESGSTPAKAGDVLVSAIATPHGVRAVTEMRVLVVIAPPI